MADIRRLPFSEIVERTQVDLMREQATSSTVEDRYKGRVNDVYMFDILSQIDWRHIRKIGSITTTNDWSTGYITDAASTTVTGDSDALWTSANSNNMILKVNGYDEVYRITYSSAVALTIDRTWIGDAISSDEVAYALTQDRYALASDYGRMILDPDKSVYWYQSGNKVYLSYKDPEEFEARQVVQAGDPSSYTIKWVNGSPYIFVDPPTDDARTIYYTYIPSLKRLSEYTTGYISALANAGTAVTGSGSDWDGYITDIATQPYYFRIDADGTGASSVWYRITSADSDTGITLTDAYGGTAISSGDSTDTYTISMISLFPAGVDSALMYGAAVISAVDQGSETQAKNFGAAYARILSQYKAIESKKDYGRLRMKTIYEKKGVRR